MGWSIGFDAHWQRDIGYGVPAVCDHPGCERLIDRGLAYVCGGEPFGGDEGCGLYFCYQHLLYIRGKPQRCERCFDGNEEPFTPTPDVPRWVRFKLKDASWKRWRAENPGDVETMRRSLKRASPRTVPPTGTRP